MAGTGEPDFNPNEPATKSDILAVLERLEKSETNLLNAFRNWAQVGERRTGTAENNLRSHEERWQP